VPAKPERSRSLCLGGAELHCHSELDPIVRRMHEILLRAEVQLGRLDRRMAKQQLDLVKLAASGAAHLRATTPEVVACDAGDAWPGVAVVPETNTLLGRLATISGGKAMRDVLGPEIKGDACA
jgi:hypothetical protein